MRRAMPFGKTMAESSGAAERIRTFDPRITNAVLYQLSYSGLGWVISPVRPIGKQEPRPNRGKRQICQPIALLEQIPQLAPAIRPRTGQRGGVIDVIRSRIVRGMDQRNDRFNDNRGP